MSVQLGLILIGIFFIFICFLAYHLTKKEKKKQEWINSLSVEELEKYNNQMETKRLKKELSDAKAESDFWLINSLWK